MKHIPNISYTTKHDLCTGCGVCAGACPFNAIKMVVKDEIFVPVVDGEKCHTSKGCHRCMDSCPGVGVDIKRIANEALWYEKTKHNERMGNYLQCYTGYSNDHDVRFHSASGGMVSQVLIWLLEKKFIQGAVVTKFDLNNELLVKTFIAMTREEILSAKSSKYSPVSMHDVIPDIKKREGKFIIVGLPCHLQGFRKYEEKDKAFKEKIFGYFGIYCSGTRTFNYTEHIFNQNHINKDTLTYLAYRDEGNLGGMVADFTEHEIGERKHFYQDYQKYNLSRKLYFFPRRCFFCIDHFAELADVSFGDIHIEPYKQDKIGINSLIVRNPKWIDIINEAESDGAITLNDLNIEPLLNSQPTSKQKKQWVATFMKLDKLFGHKVPHYDVHLNDCGVLKSIVRYFERMLQIYIGRHKNLWKLIK